MFCPKCGQQQVSEDVRFCSACGAKVRPGAGSIRRIIAMLMHIVLTALAVGGWGPWSGPMYFQVRLLILLVSVTTFLLLFSSDLQRAFSNLFRQEGESGREKLSASDTFNQVGSAPNQSALPRVSSAPVNSQRGKNTAEMVRPPSITEHTTELLDKDRF